MEGANEETSWYEESISEKVYESSSCVSLFIQLARIPSLSGE